jgi:3'-5' exoribonuclease
MSRLPRVSDLTADARGIGFFLCSRKEIRSGRGGAPFMLFTLQDATGSVCGKLFDDFTRYRDEFDVGEFVRVEGHAEVYKGRIELVVSRIRRVYPAQDREEGFRELDCIPASPRDIDEMWQELVSRIASVRDDGVRALLNRLVQDNAETFRVWPAALTVHHAYRGGLLEHVLQVARVCRTLGELYGADLDLLLAGAVLHDIGKLRELEYDLTTTYSRAGNLVGHIGLGLMMVREASAGLASLGPDRREEIEHLIASHHGARELGSPVEPMTVEAFLLAMADDLDAKVHQVQHHIAADEAPGEFTTYHTRLRRVFLKKANPES